MINKLNINKITEFTQKPRFSNHVMHWDHYIPHDHDFYEITYITKGETIHYLNEREPQLISVGNVLFLRPNDIHYYYLEKQHEIEYRNIIISTFEFEKIANFLSPTCLDEINGNDFIRDFYISANELAVYENALNTINSLPEDNENIFKLYYALIPKILGSMLDYNYVNRKNYPLWFNDLLLSIQNSDVLQNGIPQIVKITNFSHGHLCRLFKKYLNMTVTEHLNQMRLNQAKTLLTSTRMSVNEICLMSGFESMSYFNKLFKTVYKMTPGGYRKSNSFLKES